MSGHVVESLSAYLDGELVAADRQAVEAHLHLCDECARHLEDLAAVDELARALPLEAPGGYFEALPARVRFKVTARRRPGVRLPAWAWAVAAALLVAVVTPALLRDNPRPAEVARTVAPAPAAATPAAPAFASEPPAAGAAPVPARAPAEPGDLRERKEQPALVARPRQDARPPTETAKQGAVYDEVQPAPAKLARATPPQGQPLAPPATSGIAQGTLSSNEAGSQLAKSENARAKDKEASRDAGRSPSPETRTAESLAPPPGASLESAAAGQHLYEPKPEAEETDSPAAPALEAKKAGAEPRPSSAARRDADAARSEAPAPKLRFRELRTELPGTAEEARRLREKWRAFVAQGPPAAQADEGRVRTVEVGVQAWRLSNDPEDLAVVKRDAFAYLRRDDAAQGDRVRALLSTVGN